MPEHITLLVAAEVERQLRARRPLPLRWLPPKQAGEYIGLSWRTLERLRSEGRGPRWYQVGQKKVVYAVDDLDCYVLESGGAK